jgi:DNA polymerase-4
LVEMASIDEAYLDMTGTKRLHGPPLRAAHSLHQSMKADTALNCSIGIGTSRLIAKVSSAQAKPNGVLWIVPGQEAKFLAPLEVRAIPGVGKVTEQNLNALGIRKVGDLAERDEAFLEERFGKWGLALAGKAQGKDAGGWFDTAVGEDTDAKSISHEHTFNNDTADFNQLQSTLMRLSEMVGRRLREAGVYARTIQLKLRYKDFTTITRAHTLTAATQLDNDIFDQVRLLLEKNWRPGADVRLLGVHASSLESEGPQIDLLDDGRQQRWKRALSAADRLRDKYGEASVSLARAMTGRFRERTHENPAGLPGHTAKPRKDSDS